MPLYDTKCNECGNIKEVIKGMSEDLPPCSECGGNLSVYFGTDTNIGTVYKGTGWADKSLRADRVSKE